MTHRPVLFPAFLLIALHYFPIGVFAQSQNLPLDHWAYTFLDRLQTRGLYVSEDFDTRPYSREAIGEIIRQIDQKVEQNPHLLSRVEWQLFDQLKGEFYEELQRLDRKIAIKKSEYEPHLFVWRDEDIIVRGDGLFGVQKKFESKQEVDSGIASSLTYLGLGLRVDIKQSLAIYAEERSFFTGDTDSLTGNVYNPTVGLPVTLEGGDVAISDKAIGYAVFRLPWLDLEAGRDIVEWGPGFRGNLILSRNSDVYDLFKFDFRFKKFKFESFHAFLNSGLGSKYLAGRRIEIRPWKSLQMAISETVVYGRRSIEFMYINPFIPINVAERHLGDKDNNTISFDFTYFTPYNFKLYGEIFLDDFSFHKNLFNNFGNKWAVMLGGYWVNPLGLQDTDFRFELVRIEPFVYTHFDSINTYINYNNVIGHWLGPNADDWYFELAHQFHRDWRVTISWEQRRRGESNIFNGQKPPDNRKKFLSGVVERVRFYGLSLRWQIRRDFFLDLNYNFLQSRNLRHLPGYHQNNHRLQIQLMVNY